MKAHCSARARVLPVFALPLLLTAPLRAGQVRQGSEASPSTAKELMRLGHLANEAHMRGDVKEEIEYRRSYSAKAWAASPAPKEQSVDRWLVIDLNDLPLAILLDGAHEWAEAETLFRRNQATLEHEPVADNEIRSENDLHLAHLLSREGKQEEARNICAHWQRRVRHIADDALFEVKHEVPRPALYDSAEAEIGAWDLACGRPEEGKSLLEEQMDAHPDMEISYTFLSRYYFAEGEFTMGLKTEMDGISAILSKQGGKDVQTVRSDTTFQ